MAVPLARTEVVQEIERKLLVLPRLDDTEVDAGEDVALGVQPVVGRERRGHAHHAKRECAVRAEQRVLETRREQEDRLPLHEEEGALTLADLHEAARELATELAHRVDAALDFRRAERPALEQ